jgi:hypothetical protein
MALADSTARKQVPDLPFRRGKPGRVKYRARD